MSRRARRRAAALGGRPRGRLLGGPCALLGGLLACHGEAGGEHAGGRAPAARPPPHAAPPAAAAPDPAADARQAERELHEANLATGRNAVGGVDRRRLTMFAPLPEVVAEVAAPAAAPPPVRGVDEDAVAEAREARVDLGRMLFYDVRLSKNHDISCNTCHDLHHHFGAEPRQVSLGHMGQAGRRNAPSAYNAAGHVAQFWDGRAPDVEHQAILPILEGKEMASSARRAVAVVNSLPAYVRLFKKSFPGEAHPVSLPNIGRAIGAFERGLLNPGRWDRFLNGREDALNVAQQRGLTTFLNAGCAACHNGPYLGGQMYQRAGIAAPWPNQADQGRFEVTGQAADKMVFKVPSLRNVAETAPYFHDGSAADLPTAVRAMGERQLGLKLRQAEVDDIVAFLGVLTGPVPTELIAVPNLPPTNERTPLPSAL